MTQSSDSPQPVGFPSSPAWVRNTKLFVTGWLLVFFVAACLYFNQLFLYLVIAVVLSFVIRPMVDAIDKRTRVPRWIPTLFVFLVIIGGLLAIPITTLPSLVRQVLNLVNNLPNLFQQTVDLLTAFFSEPLFEFRGVTYYIPVDQITVQEYQQYLGNVVSFIGNSLGSVGDFAGNVASLTIQVVSWLAFILFVSFYLTKDGHVIADNALSIVPDEYRTDAGELMARLNSIWGAFLRGQVLLMVVIGVIVFLMASALGLPNPVALGVIAGLLEIVPYAGPVLSAIPGGLLAFFQSDASWLGSLMSPFWFMMIVLFAYWLVQQLENYILLPRIMGYQLKLHPVIVFVAVIAGWQVAGIWGIFLSSPIAATIRLFMRYAYSKLTEQSLFVRMETTLAAESNTVETETSDAARADGAAPQPDESPEPQRVA